MERDESIRDVEERIELHAHLNAQSSFDDRGIGETFSDQNFSTRSPIAFADQLHEPLETCVRKKTFSSKKLAQTRCLRKVCLDVRHESAAQVHVMP